MPIHGIVQPEVIIVSETIRLRKYEGCFDFALCWYQDAEIVKLVDGIHAKIYDMDKLERMYTYLDSHGELYFIEVYEGDNFIPIGDVTFWKENMPIVIGDRNYRGKGIGNLVINSLVQRAKVLKFDEIFVEEIYNFNIASQALFESIGFKKHKKTENGLSYNLPLT